MILNFFSPNKLAFFSQITDIFCIHVIITLAFKKNSIFSAENLRKSQKIVIITSAPDEDN
jgi:hypothetical protein